MADESVDEGDDDEEEDGDEDEKLEEEDEDDVKMDEETKPAAPSDPNDLSAFKMDEYDDEESSGVGELDLTFASRRS